MRKRVPTLLLTVVLACVPAEQKAKSPVATPSGARATDSSVTAIQATTLSAAASANDSLVRPAAIASAVRAACDSATGIVRAELFLTPDRRDGDFHDTPRGTPRNGCRLTAQGSFKALPEKSSGPVDILHAAFIRHGWQPDLRYSADGPDGSDVGMRRRDILCIVTGSWEGGDDSDTVARALTAAEDIYKLVVECAREVASSSNAGVPDSI